MTSEAKHLVAALKGKWHGRYGMARCPAHDDRTPSLSVTDADGKVLVRCFAGCEQTSVIDALRRCGLWENKATWRDPRPRRRCPRPRPAADDNRAFALKVWQKAEPTEGTAVERYLLSRGISIRPPQSIRHDYLKHGPTGMVFPAMIAAVQDVDGKVCGVQRTFLKPDGSGKAGVSNPRLSLGPITGGTVRLALADDCVCLVEGIEDGLAMQQMNDQPTWVCCGTSGFTNFVPPSHIKTVILAPDGDPAGRGRIQKAGDRLLGMGIEVLVRTPPNGMDWADGVFDYEERVAIMVEAGEEPVAAEFAAWREVFGGDNEAS